MFLIGHELTRRLCSPSGGGSLTVSVGSIAVPFAEEIALALWLSPGTLWALPGQWRGSAGSVALPFAPFIGAALAVTTLLVLTRTVDGTGLRGTRAATVSLNDPFFVDAAADTGVVRLHLRTEGGPRRVLMNTRGLTELITLGIGRQTGLLDAGLTVALCSPPRYCWPR
jgi:hypothetical protein